MADKQYEADEKKLREMERKLTDIYTQANKEVGAEWKRYLGKAEKKINELKKAISKAKTPEEKAEAEKAYRGYMEYYTLKNARYKDLTEQYAEQISKVNETAVKYINDQLPGIYSKNYNYIGEGIAGEVEGYSFSMIDENTVKNLVANDETTLPYKTINGRKDVRWNTQRVNSQVLQGIIQGESIDKIKKRLYNVTEMNKDSAYRNARTSVTSAENRGRIDMMRRAENDGVIAHKIWMSAHDGHTRDAHLRLDGQEQPREDPFSSILGEIMYPGDPEANPANVYNCRCTLTYKIVGFRKNEAVGQNTVPEEDDTPKPFESAKLKQSMDDAQYSGFQKIVEKAPTRELYEQYSDECKGITQKSSGGAYTPASDTLTYSMSKYPGQSEYSVLAHEMGHMFDAHIGATDKLDYSEIRKINDKCTIGSGVTKVFKEIPSQSNGFLNALRKDMKNIIDNGAEGLMNGNMRNSSAGVQDALDGFYRWQSRRLVAWGHGDKYYNRKYNSWIKGFGLESKFKEALTEIGLDASSLEKAKLIARQYEAASEAWANVASAVTCGGEELAAMEKYMPNTVVEFKRICEVLK